MEELPVNSSFAAPHKSRLFAVLVLVILIAAGVWGYFFL